MGKAFNSIFWPLTWLIRRAVGFPLLQQSVEMLKQDLFGQQNSQFTQLISRLENMRSEQETTVAELTKRVEKVDLEQKQQLLGLTEQVGRLQ